ncbi:acyltransferase family protein [Xenorhabdus ishibashii]|uniref:Putative acetyltransferase n=1 Tax=Xenorhabdus ishibashii TaxID=1034471 RepID=A0A2D0KEG4_9GAMM|nr:acyltransferase [Xenorhabdus ishibashii]PHM61798.1 putative acetyltransferase [Xenorhabdus ishibashii]
MMKRFESLDAIRGIGALMVVTGHLHIVNTFTDLYFFRYCYIIVELFFVLSGFVLTHTYAYRDVKFTPYISSRFFRIFPLHIFMLLIFIFLEFCRLLIQKNTGIHFDATPFTGRTAPSEILPNLFLIQSWTPTTHNINLTFNYPTWSLSVEFYTYIILYLTIITFRKMNIVPIIWLLISVTTLWLLVSGNHTLQQAVTRGVSSFFAGAFTYSIFRIFSDIKISVITATILEIICVALLIYFVRSQYEAKQIICTIVYCLTIFILAYQRGVISSFLLNRHMQHLGKISYSIYMVHVAIILIITTVMFIIQKRTGIELTLLIEGRRNLTTGNIFLNNFLALSIYFIVIATATITYNNVEAKFMKYRIKFSSSSQ